MELREAQEAIIDSRITEAHRAMQGRSRTTWLIRYSQDVDLLLSVVRDQRLVIKALIAENQRANTNENADATKAGSLASIRTFLKKYTRYHEG